MKSQRSTGSIARPVAIKTVFLQINFPEAAGSGDLNFGSGRTVQNVFKMKCHGMEISVDTHRKATQRQQIATTGLRACIQANARVQKHPKSQKIPEMSWKPTRLWCQKIMTANFCPVALPTSPEWKTSQFPWILGPDVGTSPANYPEKCHRFSARDPCPKATENHTVDQGSPDRYETTAALFEDLGIKMLLPSREEST